MIRNEAEEKAFMVFGEEAIEEDLFESRYLDSDDAEFRSNVCEGERGVISRLSEDSQENTSKSKKGKREAGGEEVDAEEEGENEDE